MKFVLIPLGIVAFLFFLLLLGAIGLAVSMGVLSVFGRLWRLVMRREASPPAGGFSRRGSRRRS